MPTPDLGTPARTIEVIQKYEFAFQKKFGQNFLIDPHVLGKIVRASGVTKEDCVLEIGPGIGTLTQYLACEADRVIAVEIDRGLMPVLAETLREYDNVEVVNADIMKVDIPALLAERNITGPVKVVANLPYYITTPILMHLLENEKEITSITVMIQKEVAERMQAAPGGKDYGALSLAVQYYAKPYLAANVPPNCFMPRPAVGSAVIHLASRAEPAVRVKDEKQMFRLIRAAFNQRRKTLVNALRNAQDLAYSREEVEEALKEAGLPEMIRGEALTLSQFALLSDLLPAGNAQ